MCLQMDDSWKNTSKWHRVDELMMELLRRIAFEGNIRKSTILFHLASKFGSLPHQINSVIDEIYNFSESDDTNRITLNDINWNNLRNEYRKLDSFIIYKWVKKMSLLISNQNIFCGDHLEVALNLRVSNNLLY